MKSIEIGSQEWADTNHSVAAFSTGDTIPLVNSLEEWASAYEEHKPACCFFDFNEKKNKSGGLLYNWFAIHDERGLAPKGWKIPSDKDWQKLIDFCGKKRVAGAKLKSNEGWIGWGDIDEANGQNDYGFNIKATGYILKRTGYDFPEFMNQGYSSVLWSCDLRKGSNSEVWTWSFNSGDKVEREGEDVQQSIPGFSVRFIKQK